MPTLLAWLEIPVRHPQALEQPRSEVWLEKLAVVTKLEPTALQAASLQSLEGRLFTPTFGRPAWIVPVASQPLAAIKQGFPYCAACLCEDQRPYFRRDWLIALLPLCPRHVCVLLDHCPSCHTPVSFIRSGWSRVPHAAALPLHRCWCCTHDLRDQATTRVDLSAPISILARCLTDALETGCVHIAGNAWVATSEYLRLVGACIAVLGHETEGAKLRDVTARGLDTAERLRTYWRERQLFFERCDPTSRHHILERVAWLLEEFPTRMSSVFRSIRLRRTLFLRHLRPVPQWFHDAQVFA